MRLRARPWCVVLLSLLACRTGTPVRIGDAMPRDRGPRSTIDLVQRRLDSLTGDARRLEIVIPDSGWVDDQVDQAYRFADDPGIAAVVGHAGSREALLGARVYNARHLPQIVPMATSHHLGQAGPWTFRLVPNDSVEGEVLADAAVDTLGAKAIAVFYEGDEYGIGLRDGVLAGLRRRGVEAADIRLPEGECRDESSFAAVRPVVRAALRRGMPDLVILAMHNELAACLMPLIDAALPAQRYLAGDGVFLGDPAIRSSAPRREGRLWRVAQWVPDTTDPLVRAFTTEFRRATGRTPTAPDALTLDAYMLLADAVRATGGGREAIRDWLASLGRDRPAWRGVTGAVTFTGERRELLRLVRVPGDPP